VAAVRPHGGTRIAARDIRRASAVAAVLLAAGVVVAAVAAADTGGPVAARTGVAGVALFVVAVAARRERLLAPALVALTATCAIALDGAASQAPAALWGSGLLVASQLAYRSIELRVGGPVEMAAVAAWLVETAAAGFAGLAAGTVVLVAAAAPVSAGLAERAAGALAALGALILLVVLARRAARS
jgi:hypothetical protein